MEENTNTKKCKEYIDFLLLTGFHKKSNKNYFFKDFGKINKFCNITKYDMLKIKKILIEIQSNN